MSHSIISFRTRQALKKSGEWSTKKIRSHGSEYDSIRPATIDDDARDIAWKQYARSSTLSIKSREDVSSIDISVIGISDESWEFTLEKNDDKHNFFDHLVYSSEYTSKVQKHTYKKSFFEKNSLPLVSAALSRQKVQKKLILIVVSSLDISAYETLSWLSRQNDIIIIHLFHPYEEDPMSDTLVESSIIDTIRYKKDFSDTKTAIKNTLGKLWISYISALSSDVPSDLLNHFFKYRYV